MPEQSERGRLIGLGVAHLKAGGKKKGLLWILKSAHGKEGMPMSAQRIAEVVSAVKK